MRLSATLLILPSVLLLCAEHHAHAWQLTLSIEQNVGVFQEDVFTSTHLQAYYELEVPQLGQSLLASADATRQTSLRVLVQAPLRIRLGDRAPLGDPLGFREQDWDSPRDAFRVVRRVGYGEPGSPFYMEIGELNAVSMLDGALIDHAFNAVNPDAPALGVLMTSSTPTQDASVMLDDVIAPGVIGAGFRARPFAIAKREPLTQRFGVGVQVAADVSAPTRLERNEQGFIEVDATSAPTVLERQATVIGGPAVEFWILARQQASLLAHAEVFWHDRLGRGEHVGLSGQWSPNQLWGFQLKSSAIFAHDRYVPRYISSLYQVERYQIQGLGAELPETKLGLVSALTPRQDLYIASTFELDLSLWKSALMVDYLWARDTPQGDALTVSARSQPIDEVALYLFYHQNFFEGFPSGLDLERSLIGSELRVMPWGPLYVVARYDRRWRLRDDGRWQGIQDWHVGVGAQLSFGAL